MMSRLYLYACIFTGLLFVACRPSNHPVPPEQSSKTTKPEIIFLSFTMKSDSNAQNTIALIGKTIREGTLKEASQNNPAGNRIELTMLDANKRSLHAITSEHPLLKHVEYTNDKGELERKAIALKKIDFVIRTILPSTATTVRVTEVRNDKPSQSFEFNLR